MWYVCVCVWCVRVFHNLSRCPQFCHADAFDTALMKQTLERILQGKTVKIPVYDFKTHSRYTHVGRVTEIWILTFHLYIFSACVDYAQILYYYSILEFSHAIAIILMQVLLLCYYAHFMIEKTPQTQRGTNIPPTGVRLSPLFILAAVTDGQNVTVLMLVVASLSSVSWLCLIFLQPRDDLRMYLAIIPA